MNKIELKKLDTPKTYKDIYYIIYFSINLNDNKYTLNSNEIVDFKYIEEKNNIIKYSATTSNMGKNIEVLDKIIDKYGK